MLTHLRSWPFRTLSFRFRWIWQNASTITRITIVTSLHFSNMMNKYKKGSRGSSSSSTKSTLHSGRSIINATLHDTWSEFYYVRDNNTEDESELPGDDRHLRPKKNLLHIMLDDLMFRYDRWLLLFCRRLRCRISSFGSINYERKFNMPNNTKTSVIERKQAIKWKISFFFIFSNSMAAKITNTS